MALVVEQRNQEATVYVGQLDEKVDEEMLWELFIQCGPVVSVHMPKDKVINKHQGYGFVEYRTEEDAEYAIKVMNMIKLYDKPLRVNKSSSTKQNLDIGANLFIGGLHPDVDEKLLYDTFSAFGGIIITPKVARDDYGNSKGYGFVKYDSFEAADMAIDCMHGQFLCNQAIAVQYAYKQDAHGERHGSDAERLLAASDKTRKASVLRPHTMFAAGPAAPAAAGGAAAPPLSGAGASGMPVPPRPPAGMGMPWMMPGMPRPGMGMPGMMGAMPGMGMGMPRGMPPRPPMPGMAMGMPPRMGMGMPGMMGMGMGMGMPPRPPGMPMPGMMPPRPPMGMPGMPPRPGV